MSREPAGGEEKQILQLSGQRRAPSLKRARPCKGSDWEGACSSDPKEEWRSERWWPQCKVMWVHKDHRKDSGFDGIRWESI